MRWQRLFDDLAGEFESEAATELAVEVAERTRIEIGRQRMLDRLQAGVGRELAVSLGGERTHGLLTFVGSDVIGLVDGQADVLIPTDAIDHVAGLGSEARPVAEGPAAPGYGLRAMLRAVARDRGEVVVVLREGARLRGRIDAVGADWFDLATHEPEATRSSTRLLVAVASVAIVRSA